MDKFAFKIACLCAIAFICPVIMATYVDSHVHNFIYGIRYYWMGYWIILGSAFPFFLAYMFNKSYNSKTLISRITGSAKRRSLFTLLSLFIPMSVALWWNFQPEFPLISISVNYFLYGIIISSIVYVHGYKFDYLGSPLDDNAKLERIKLEHKKWRNTFWILAIMFIIICLFMYSVFFVLPKQYTDIQSEQTLIFNSFIIDLFIGIILAIFASIEILRKIAKIEYETFNIQRKVDLGKLYSLITRNGYLLPFEEGKEVIDRKFNELLDDLHDP